tara:strand:+ start:395 stop:781 length:387 start_codon:yes stop_codon:yes gene_type:complete
MKRIWTNGCFDILHVGHIELFKYARSLGCRLTVGIDSDKRVSELKGKNRPINDENYRKKMLSSIRWVDNVVVFNDEKELCDSVQKHADIIVVGSDYKNKRVIGSEWAEVVFFDKIEGYSTTKIIEGMK